MQRAQREDLNSIVEGSGERESERKCIGTNTVADVINFKNRIMAQYCLVILSLAEL